MIGQARPYICQQQLISNLLVLFAQLMEQNRGNWVKKIPEETTLNRFENTNHSSTRANRQHLYFYVGSLVCWGLCHNQFHTDNDVQQLSNRTSNYNGYNLSLYCQRRQQIFQIQSYVPFSMFISYLDRTKIGKVQFSCQVPKNRFKDQSQQREDFDQKQKQLVKQLLSSKKNKQKKRLKEKIVQNQQKKNLSKKRSKKVIPVRMDIYMNKQIYNENSPVYSENLKKLDKMQELLNTLKASSTQYKDLRQEMHTLIEEQLYFQKIARSLLLYFMEKANVRVVNRSFIKPPPKLNYLMREYRRLTIGLITKNKRDQRRLQRKVLLWKSTFQTYSLFHTCIGPINNVGIKNKYYNSLPNQTIFWDKRESGLGFTKIADETYKFQIKMGMVQKTQSVKKVLAENRKKVMDQIGAYGFGDEGQVDSDDQDQEENQASKKMMDIDEYKLMKKNQSLMEKFQTQNKYFKIHPTPSQMISQLKPYQGQALQWMKYREGKIPVEQLFEKQYQNQVHDFQFQRKLSPFWEEIQLLSGQKFYANYLTGQFTKIFHDWKSIRGGILADQMGLGKTVMTLSLLADQQWQGLNLIIVPVAVLLQWKQQIKKHCGQDIKVFQFHSDSKNRRKKNLQQYHIVLITYSTLGHQYKLYQGRNRDGNDKYLFDYNFQRVILDQAHNIRSINTQQFKAAMNLKSKYSWCLTGTLIQNSQQDLFAIFRFLRVQVFSQESWWNQYIKNAGCNQAKMNVIQTVLRPIVLRRTKASTSNQGQAIIQLTKKIQITIRPQFTKKQAIIYQKLQTGVRKFFRTNVQSGRSYTHVFQIISKLRQFCCHPALIFGSDAEDIQQKDIQQVLNKFLEGKVSGSFKQSAVSAMMKNDQNCVICLTQPDEQNAILTQCGHFFCEPCIKRTMSINPNCPICRKPLTPSGYVKKSDFMGTDDLKDLTESSKVTAILSKIQQIHQKGEKCVIFTQWIKIIGIISDKLTQRDIQFETIMGDMSPEKRQRAIKKFRQRNNCSFLIVSIRAGAVGLNLAFANNVIICDPWWNPSHQDQAIGRVHRIGQTKDVNVYRFIMKKSIEQKIQKMHQGKKRLANQVMMQKGSLQDSKATGTEQLIRLLEG